MNESAGRPSRLLITGDTGFVGSHALKMWPDAVGLSRLIDGADICRKADLVDGLHSYRPDTVLHLAALSFVPDSFLNPASAYNINFFGTLNLLEALKETGFKGRFLYISTGDAYGLVTPAELPIQETQAFRPRSPYAVSKVAAEALCYQWSQTGPFEVLMTRPFNHIGPGQAPSFAVSDFAKQIAEIRAGKRARQLHVGNIDVTRDFTDVQDVLRAYELIFASGRNGEAYNVCSGVERSMRSLVQGLITLADVDVEIITDLTRFRASEQLRVCGSYAKLKDHTGWNPSVSIEETLLNLYRYWEIEVVK